jgi:hypothetical protein
MRAFSASTSATFHGRARRTRFCADSTAPRASPAWSSATQGRPSQKWQPRSGSSATWSSSTVINRTKDALVALLDVSNTHSAVFMDEVTTQACVDGTYASGADHARQCAALDAGYWPSVRAYNRACREGWLSVQSCAWPGRHRHDGICLGRFGRRRRAHKRAPTKRKQ